MVEERKREGGEGWKVFWIGLLTLSLLTLSLTIFHSLSPAVDGPIISSHDPGVVPTPSPTVFESFKDSVAGPVWGSIFSSLTISSINFPKLDCEFHQMKICCSAMENKTKKNKKQHKIPVPHYHHCLVTKQYYPSPYEIRHLEVAEELAKIKNIFLRTKKLIEFIESEEEIEHCKRWLDRIAVRQTGMSLSVNDIDREYLSRYRVTRKCHNNLGNHSWWEYIEPLSIHARHPFALGECWHPHFIDQTFVYNGTVPKTPLLSLDYILLQTPSDLTGRHANTSLIRHSSRIPSTFGHEVFLFDAGTSRFDSSLFWFICAYEQVIEVLCHLISLLTLISLALSSIISSDGNSLYLNR